MEKNMLNEMYSVKNKCRFWQKAQEKAAEYVRRLTKFKCLKETVFQMFK